MKRQPFRLLLRWALISASLSGLLFLAVGTSHIASLRAYLALFSVWLLVTMLAVDPRLAGERAHPRNSGVNDGLRCATGSLFLLTLTVAAFSVGRLHPVFIVPTPIRDGALVVFAASASLQAWAMVQNPFFSPVLRVQSERGHHLIDTGPYRFVRHPGYLAMCVSIPASAVAIGSWLALFPATAFVIVIRHRAEIEDQFLRINLFGYVEYAQRVRSGLPLGEARSIRQMANARSYHE